MVRLGVEWLEVFVDLPLSGHLAHRRRVHQALRKVYLEK